MGLFVATLCGAFAFLWLLAPSWRSVVHVLDRTLRGCTRHGIRCHQATQSHHSVSPWRPQLQRLLLRYARLVAQACIQTIALCAICSSVAVSRALLSTLTLIVAHARRLRVSLLLSCAWSACLARSAWKTERGRRFAADAVLLLIQDSLYWVLVSARLLGGAAAAQLTACAGAVFRQGAIASFYYEQVPRTRYLLFWLCSIQAAMYRSSAALAQVAARGQRLLRLLQTRSYQRRTCSRHSAYGCCGVSLAASCTSGHGVG